MGEAHLGKAGAQFGEIPLTDDQVDVVSPPVRSIALDRYPADEEDLVPQPLRDLFNDLVYVRSATSSKTFSRASASRRSPGARASRNSM